MHSEIQGMLEEINKLDCFLTDQKIKACNLICHFHHLFQEKLKKPDQLKGAEATLTLRPGVQLYHA